jgi:sulfite reductase alpha subunit-like flavoprotein
MKCAVLGLGDSGYAQFNFVAKRLDKRLRLLGKDYIFLSGNVLPFSCTYLGVSLNSSMFTFIW